MQLKVHNTNGEVVGEVEVSDDVFGAEVKPHLFWEVVRWQRAKKRAGTHASKTRAAVVGSTKKAFRQKGTGRARHGDYKAPIFVGGGKAHGPQPRSYEFKVNKKARRGALRSALSMKVAEEKLTVVDSFELAEIKTKHAAAALGSLGANRALVIDGGNEILNKSVRNLAAHKYLDAAGLNIFDLLKYESVVITKDALASIDGRLKK